MTGLSYKEIQEKIKEFEKEIIQEFEQAFEEKYVPKVKFENKWKGVFTNGNSKWTYQQTTISVGNNNLTVELYKNIIEITINNNKIKFELEKEEEEIYEFKKILYEELVKLQYKIDEMYWQYLLKLVQKIDANAKINNDDSETWIEFSKDGKVYRFYPKIDENYFDGAGIHCSSIVLQKVTLNDIIQSAEEKAKRKRNKTLLIKKRNGGERMKLILLSALPLREAINLTGYVELTKLRKEELEYHFKKKKELEVILVMRHPTTKEVVKQFLSEMQEKYNTKMKIIEKDTITTEELKNATVFVLVPKKEFGVYNRQEFEIKSIDDLDVIFVWFYEY